MSDDAIPLLWLCGPPGVGKSTVGWEVFSQLTQAGTTTGYLDIDQLGLCYPEPPSDPDRHRMKAQNLGATVLTFQAVGARCVIVSGVVDAMDGVRGYAEQIPQATLTVCRLRSGHDELRERFIRRGARLHEVAAVVREADALDRSGFADVCVDTSGLSVAEVTRLVREQAGGWPVLTGGARSSRSEAATPRPQVRTVTPASGGVLWLCGPTGVGKSTVGWEIFQEVIRAGSTAAYVDLDQVGFCRPVPVDDPDNHRVKARNLAAVWRTYRASGARCLIVVGSLEDRNDVRTYTAALPATAFTLCRLHAGRDQLTQRIMLRGQGGGPVIPGDPLKGQPTATLHRIADKAVADAEASERAAIGDLRIDTDGRTIEELAHTVLTHAAGWPAS